MLISITVEIMCLLYKAMLPVCHVLSGVGFVLQVYWLHGVIKIFVARAKDEFKKTKPTNS